MDGSEIGTQQSFFFFLMESVYVCVCNQVGATE
jgi:hypothetical protein